ncbi:hypothetical protein DFJ74DRAFT_703717 [Hyaloraphidium curvatum]|nr:hypothetical protein DFJ74DRAFT_703717 [Hyaloraphidium curvatum]
MLGLGPGLLARRLFLPFSTRDEEDPFHLLDKYRDLLSENIAPWKFSRVEELTVEVWKRDPFFGELLRMAGPSPKMLELRASDSEGVEVEEDPQADPFLPLLSHLDGLESLREIKIDDPVMSSYYQVPDSCSWVDAFSELPRAASCLIRVTADDTTVADWAKTRFPSIEVVDFSATGTPENLASLTGSWTPSPALGRLECLYVDECRLDL